MVLSRSVTAALDMSTLLSTKPRSASKRATSRRRDVTACARISTTSRLLQTLHVHQILRTPSGQLEGDEIVPGNDPHVPSLDLRRLSPLPGTLQGATDQQRIEHERLVIDDLRESLDGDAAGEIHGERLEHEPTPMNNVAKSLHILWLHQKVDVLGRPWNAVDGKCNASA